MEGEGGGNREKKKKGKMQRGKKGRAFTPEGNKKREQKGIRWEKIDKRRVYKKKGGKKKAKPLLVRLLPKRGSVREKPLLVQKSGKETRGKSRKNGNFDRGAIEKRGTGEKDVGQRISGGDREGR